jgi:hypothetical protein
MKKQEILERFLLHSRAGRSKGERDYLLEKMPKQSVCAEIGVYKGDFSARIIRIVTPQQLHLIDPWKYERSATYRESFYGGKAGGSQANMDSIFEAVLKRFRRQITTEAVRVHRSNSIDASAAFPDDYFDWIYIDGNHQYEFVKRDLEAYYRKVKKGGYITGDDYGVVGWWQDGVKRAVEDFISKASVEVLQMEGHQFCLRKK